MFYKTFLMFLVSSTLAVTAKLQGLPVNLTTVGTSSRNKLEIYKTFCNQTESDRIYTNIQNVTKNIKPIHHQRLNIRGDKKIIEITENIWNATSGDESAVSNVDNNTTVEYFTNTELDQITEITTTFTLLSTEQYENSSSNLLNTTTTNSGEYLYSHSFVLASNETSESTTKEMDRHTVEDTTQGQRLTQPQDNTVSSVPPLLSTQQPHQPSSNKTINFTMVDIDESTTEQINKMSTTNFSNDKLIKYEQDKVTEDYTHSSINNNHMYFTKYESNLEQTTLKAVSMPTYVNLSYHSTSAYLTTNYNKENGVSTDETLLPGNATVTVAMVTNTVAPNKITVTETPATKIESPTELTTTAENLIIFNTNETDAKMTTLEPTEIVTVEETVLTSNSAETEMRQTTEIDVSELVTECSEQTDLHTQHSTQYSTVYQTNESDLSTTFLPHVTPASTEVSTETEAIENTQHSQGTITTIVTHEPITTINKEIVLKPTETNDSEFIGPVYYYPFNNFTIEIPQKRQQVQSIHQPLQSFFLTFPSKRLYSVRNPTGRTLANRS